MESKMKLITRSIAVLPFIVMIGCASTPTNTGLAEQDVPPDCTHLDNPKKAAPLWVCTGNMPGSGYDVSARGFADQRSESESINQLERRATLDAQNKLAASMATRVSSMVKDYIESTGSDDYYTEETFTESLLKSITDETLRGARIYFSTRSPDGGLYILMGLDESLAERATKSMLQTSMGNERALWSKFLADKADEELAEEIAKYREMK
jgi:hypothetical protein